MNNTNFNTTLADIFKRFHTEDPYFLEILKLPVVNCRVNHEKATLEATVSAKSLIRATQLYAFEDAARSFYKLNVLRILPKYPSEIFGWNCVEEVLKETERVGAVARGFFDGCDYECSRDSLTIRVPFVNGALRLLEDAETAKIIHTIILAEFDLDCKVTIVGEKNPDHMREFNRKLADLDRKLNDSFLSYKNAERQSEAGSAPDSDLNLTRVMSICSPDARPVSEGNGVIRIGPCVFETDSRELLYGEDFNPEPRAIGSLKDPARNLVILGVVQTVSCETRKYNDTVTVAFDLYDGSSTITVKIPNLTQDEGNKLAKLFDKGTALCVHGVVKHETRKDSIDPDLTCYCNAVYKIRIRRRKDDAPVKRVELHLHTQMSNMDALIPPDVAVMTAHDWGMPAIAITDHGSVQGFQEALKILEKKKPDTKVIWGMEAYFVNNMASAVYGKCADELRQEAIVFDLETTGLEPGRDHIIEIGAVRIVNGKITDTFDTFVDPEIEIPEKITELTSITNEDVIGAPKIDEALDRFYAFVNGETGNGNRKLLIAHNARFDTGFLRIAMRRLDRDFENPFLDTLVMSRYLEPKMKNHKLDTLVEHYQLGDFHHHRAVDDAEVLGRVWLRMIGELESREIRTFSQLEQEMSEVVDPKRQPMFHQILLVKNLTGLKNLYKLVSYSYLDYYYKRPRIPKAVLEEHREGLIVGSACEAGELYRAILDKRPESEIEEIVQFYDYLEIQPLSNNHFLIDKGEVADEEELREINRTIVRLGEKYGKPVCATCDAHFLNEEDEVFRKILLAGQKYEDADRDCHLYLRTTQEMLDEFAYLGPEKAYEVVVTNTNRIADMCEKGIRPFPEGTFTPKMEGAEEDLQTMCRKRARELYGDPLPEYVDQRLEKELGSIISHGFAVLYIIAQKLVKFSESQGYLVGSRGSVGSSCVAFFAGISEVNPLKPHYYCPKCHYTDFDAGERLGVGSGFDLPDAKCPNCGADLCFDGQDIPFETFLGFHGDKSPDIDLNFSGEVQGRVHKYTESLFGSENVFRAGTIGVLADKTAYGYIIKYLEEKGVCVPRAEMNRMVSHCTGVKRTTGQHPGGIVVVPKEYEIYDFCPVQHPADDPQSDIVTTHFTFSYLHDTLLKLDELGHDIPTKYKYLEKYSNTSVLDVPMNDRSIYDLFLGTEPLGITPEDINCPLGTLGLPELGTRFVIQMLQESRPQSFADLLQVSGLSHGTDVWTGNAQELIANGTCTISTVIGTRDSIMLALIKYGVESSDAFKIMEMVRKGKGLTPELEKEMVEAGVPDWYISSCKKIKYMFPKAHAAAYDMSAIRLGWYKVHQPLAFYCAMFTVQPGGFDAEIVIKGKTAVEDELRRIADAGKQATPKETDSVPTLQLVNEAYARGIRFLPVDLLRSSATEYKPESGAIRLPFSSLPGIGENAARSITRARDEHSFVSVQDISKRAGVTKTVIEILTRNRVLDGLDETDQISIFNMV